MLSKHITNEQTGISYILHGDYYLPNLVLPEQEDNRTIGKWGERVPVAFKQARQSPQTLSATPQKAFYNYLISNLTLHTHLADIDEQARDMFDTLTEQMMKREGVTEELKEQNHIEWICRMGNIQERANETICSELIYA